MMNASITTTQTKEGYDEVAEQIALRLTELAGEILRGERSVMEYSENNDLAEVPLFNGNIGCWMSPEQTGFGTITLRFGPARR